jgi:hypothetical protein
VLHNKLRDCILKSRAKAIAEGATLDRVELFAHRRGILLACAARQPWLMKER